MCMCLSHSLLFVGYAEADTFFCFATLMGEISDNFNQDLDRSEYGIGACAMVRMEHEGVLGVNDVLCSKWLFVYLVPLHTLHCKKR